MPHNRIDYIGSNEIARWLGVRSGTISKWRQRDLGFPEPDATIGSQTCGWLPERKDEILAWWEKHGRRP